MFNNGAGFRAGGTIAPSRFVTIDTTEDGQVIQATAGALVTGISQAGMKRAPGLPGSDTAIAAEDGDVIQLYALGDVCPLTVGAAVVRGDKLKSDANGKGIPVAAGTDEVGALALQSGGADGVIVLVQIISRPSA